jgi:hypothetical protein
MRLMVMTVVTSMMIVATPAEAIAPAASMEQMVSVMEPRQKLRFAIGTLTKDKSEIDCSLKIAFKESRYRLEAKNKRSSATGAWQLMWGHPRWSVFKQATEAHEYVLHRYGSWCEAYKFHQERNWF